MKDFRTALQIGIILCFLSQIYHCSVHNRHIEEYISSHELRNAGYEEFDISTVFQKNKRTWPINKRTLTQESLDLELSAFGEEFHLSAKKVNSVLHPRAEVLVTRGDVEYPWTGNHPNCFLSGELTSHDGFVTLSYCETLHGLMSTPNHTYRIEKVPEHLQPSGNAHNQMLVARKKITNEYEYGTDQSVMDSSKEALNYQHQLKRNVPSTSFTIETAVFTDAPFTELFRTNDTAKRLELMMLKYNMVQMEWGRYDVLGYDVTIQIKYINFFEVDPSWYNMSGGNNTGLLKTLCSGTHYLPHDHVFMHTGYKGVLGLSYQSSICKHGYRCGFESSRDVLTYIATAHETGHGLGMHHDADRNCTPPDVGIMGKYGAGWSSCSVRDMNHWLNSGHGACLWREDVPMSNVSVPLQHVHFQKELIGQTYSPDEVCEILHSPGFAFRPFPHLNVCKRFSCADLSQGDMYGRMFVHTNNIAGQYCGDGKICFKNNCKTWEFARQYNLTARAGGWSDWSDWVPCTRTCGIGVTFRKRTCTNPTPKNHSPCEGMSYQAVTCNPTPCNDDSDDKPTLIKQRASETCARLISNGHLDGSMYRPSGDRYNNDALLGQCEVQCESQPGLHTPGFTRFGLMPDGTPCDFPGIENWDKSQWPRRHGYHGRCVEGYCMKFDCTGKTGKSEIDGCGVCGGDNSTCIVKSGIQSNTLEKGVRTVIASLPTGAYNIQFWTEYSHTHQTFIELWSKDGAPIIASYVASSWVWDDRANPIEFDGTFWYFLFRGQYLYTKGPITSPAVIKAFQHNSTQEMGIHYAYSLPLTVKSCSGPCDHNGIWNQKLCSCTCPHGFYGSMCNSKCNKYCMNGAPLDETTCRCLCNDRQTGGNCHCKNHYTGKECRDCKTVLDCHGHGTFNTVSCQCDCASGFTGNTCETALLPDGAIVG